MRDEAAISALNNAEWCDAVCRAHGVPGSFAADIWTQPLRGPAYYSNAITLSHGGLATQRAAIDALAPALRHDYSVKDAFNCWISPLPVFVRSSMPNGSGSTARPPRLRLRKTASG